MSKSQSSEVFACEDASVATAGFSVISAVAGQELIERNTITLCAAQCVALTMQCSSGKMKAAQTILMWPGDNTGSAHVFECRVLGRSPQSRSLIFESFDVCRHVCIISSDI